MRKIAKTVEKYASYDKKAVFFEKIALDFSGEL